MLKKTISAVIALLLLLPCCMGFAAQAEEEETPVIEIVTNSAYDEGGKANVSVTWQTLRLLKGTKGFDELGAALKKFSDKKDKEKKDLLKELKKTAKEIVKSTGKAPEEMLNEYSTASVERFDGNVLSVAFLWDGYYGGVHGDHGVDTLNIDIRTGTPVQLKDAVADPVRFAAVLKERLTSLYSEDEFFDLDGYLENVKNGTAEPAFTIGADCLNIYFGTYEISSYAAGGEALTLRFADYPGMFTEKVIHCGEKGFFGLESEAVQESLMFSALVDGKPVTLAAKSSSNGDLNALTLSAGGQNETLRDLYFYSVRPYIVKNGADTYLWVFLTGDNDYVSLYTANVTGGSAKWNAPVENLSFGSMFDREKDGVISYAERIPCDPEHVLLGTHCDVLGTYSALSEYAVDGDGVPQRLDWLYTVSSAKKIRTNAKLKGTVVNEDGKGTKPVSLPKGTEMRVYRTDGTDMNTATFVDVQLRKDGKIVRFTYGPAQNGSYGAAVAGVSEEKAFKSLPYAG